MSDPNTTGKPAEEILSPEAVLGEQAGPAAPSQADIDASSAMIEGDTPATPEATVEAKEETVSLKDFMETHTDPKTVSMEALRKALLPSNPLKLDEDLYRDLSIVRSEFEGPYKKAMILGTRGGPKTGLGIVYFKKDEKLCEVSLPKNVAEEARGEELETRPALAKALVETCGFDYAYEMGPNLCVIISNAFRRFAE